MPGMPFSVVTLANSNPCLVNVVSSLWSWSNFMSFGTQGCIVAWSLTLVSHPEAKIYSFLPNWLGLRIQFHEDIAFCPSKTCFRFWKHSGDS